MSAVQTPPGRETFEPPTGATHHLCIGTYVDEEFRNLVIDEVCTAPYRRVAPSYGFDLVPVMRHAWWATHLQALPRLAIAACVLVPLVGGQIVSVLLSLCALASLLLLRRACQLSVAISFDRPSLSPLSKKKPSRARLSPEAWRGKRWEKAALQKTGMGLLTIAAAWVLLTGSFPGQALLSALLLLTVPVAAVLAGTLSQIRINKVRESVDLRPRCISPREKAVDAQQDHACVVYQRPAHDNSEDDEEAVFTLFGDDSPFIGAGELIHQWNPPMSIPLLRPGSDEQPLHEREYETPPFRAHELVEYLRGSVEQLRWDQEDVRLPVEVRDRVYIAETDVSIDRELLKEPVGPAAMRRIIDGQSASRHHFLEVSVPEAGSELTATVLLQVNLQGRTLSLSFAACVLTRTPRKFQQVNEFGQYGKGAVLRAALRELIRLPRLVESSPRVFRYPWVLAKALVLPSELTHSPIRNVLIGTRFSVREHPAQEWRKVQFEKTRLLGQIKTIERRLLRAASDFLTASDVDTSEFNNRATQIVNSGILNLGGNNEISHSSVGSNAQTHNTAPSQQPPAGSTQNGSAA
ncbi:MULTISPECIES: hypothetical protein [Nocardiopsidaceae]|uniref:Aromatic ring-opening dioxygenase LigA n=2 Tax=Nocardiopsidaceae TaxID=83676 RepID=A0ABY6YTK7_9ACTN|nr:hypothetical protein [Streptomonospora nanhaiensis]WAE75543.1 hypothetical protein OUQ99_10870 [Streptomonospora nanhaiensis]